jgi:hypothetical protein
MPFALFDFTLLDSAVFSKLQPNMRLFMLEGVLTIINWLRELLNGYGLALSAVCACLSLSEPHRGPSHL